MMKTEDVMKTAHKPRAPRVPRSEKGFSLIEMMVAMMITMIVMASVFTLLQKGQTTFQREPEVAEMNQNARYGLDMIVRDLTDAGLGANLPVLFAVVPIDGDVLRFLSKKNDVWFPKLKPVPVMGTEKENHTSWERYYRVSDCSSSSRNNWYLGR